MEKDYPREKEALEAIDRIDKCYAEFHHCKESLRTELIGSEEECDA